MAQQLIARNTCDWHSALGQPETVEATHTRLNPHGTLNDLCAACAMVFDWLSPRVEDVLKFVDREVLETLFRLGRTPDSEKRSRAPAQLPLVETPAVPEPAGKPATPPVSSGQKAVANRGRWIDGEDQVRCPLDHPGANSAKEYWVKVKDRHSHAQNSHGLMGPQIAYELPADGSVVLPYACFEHKVCADSGGYGQKSKGALSTHIFKANNAGWEKADKDPTETSEQQVTAA